VFFVYKNQIYSCSVLKEQEKDFDQKRDVIDKFEIKIQELNAKIDSLKLRMNENSNQESVLPAIIRDNKVFMPDLLPVSGDFALSQEYKSDHKAIDFAASTGQHVLASASGIVVKIYEDKYLGHVVIIDHLNDYKTFYAHLESFLCRKGELVNKGDVIAKLGNTGNSSNPHLHFEIYYKDKLVNPHRYIMIPNYKFNNKGADHGIR
jgi:murein DD-endopeptidase MepM/ murein hydrolase activator NlpD